MWATYMYAHGKVKKSNINVRKLDKRERLSDVEMRLCNINIKRGVEKQEYVKK